MSLLTADDIRRQKRAQLMAGVRPGEDMRRELNARARREASNRQNRGVGLIPREEPRARDLLPEDLTRQEEMERRRQEFVRQSAGRGQQWARDRQAEVLPQNRPGLAPGLAEMGMLEDTPEERRRVAGLRMDEMTGRHEKEVVARKQAALNRKGSKYQQKVQQHAERQDPKKLISEGVFETNELLKQGKIDEAIRKFNERGNVKLQNIERDPEGRGYIMTREDGSQFNVSNERVDGIVLAGQKYLRGQAYDAEQAGATAVADSRRRATASVEGQVQTQQDIDKAIAEGRLPEPPVKPPPLTPAEEAQRQVEKEVAIAQARKKAVKAGLIDPPKAEPEEPMWLDKPTAMSLRIANEDIIPEGVDTAKLDTIIDLIQSQRRALRMKPREIVAAALEEMGVELPSDVVEAEQAQSPSSFIQRQLGQP
jgi:hypothetical protein